MGCLQTFLCELPSVNKFVLTYFLFLSPNFLVFYTDQLLTAKILQYPDNPESASTVTGKSTGKQRPGV